jgi:hypothetical protein
MPPLTDYEAAVVQAIATWKNEPLSLYTRMANRATRPLANLFSRFVPRAVGVQGVSAAYAASNWLVGPEEVLKRAGLPTLDELRAQPLEFCDKLAGQVDRNSQTFAAVDGAVTGAGGFLLAAADVAALTMIVLRAIRRTGQCYGYVLDQPQDRPYVLGILMVACTRSPTERLELLGKLSNIEKWLVNGTVEAVLIEGLSKQLLKLASVEAIPVIGALMGSTANLVFCRHVTRSARCVFQERWLIERGRYPASDPSSPAA